MKKLWLAALAAAGMVLGFAGADQRSELDPLQVAGDTHKLAYENKFVRVLEVRLPPGKIEPLHSHPHGLSVYFKDLDARITPWGGEPTVHHRKAGTFAWSEAIVHTVENVGKTEGHVLRVELKY